MMRKRIRTNVRPLGIRGRAEPAISEQADLLYFFYCYAATT